MDYTSAVESSCKSDGRENVRLKLYLFAYPPTE